MIRWTGLFAAGLSAVLVLIFVKRTEVVELAGLARFTDVPLVNTHVLEQRHPGWRVLFVTDRGAAGENNRDLDRFSAAKIASTLFSGGEDKTLRTWLTLIPEEAAASLQEDDEVVIVVCTLKAPGDGEASPRLVRYRFRRGTTTWSAGEPENRKFFAAYALAGGGPLLLWGAGALTVYLGKARAKSGLRE